MSDTLKELAEALLAAELALAELGDADNDTVTDKWWAASDRRRAAESALLRRLGAGAFVYFDENRKTAELLIREIQHAEVTAYARGYADGKRAAK